VVKVRSALIGGIGRHVFASFLLKILAHIASITPKTKKAASLRL
jgi:hypothetical protein